MVLRARALRPAFLTLLLHTIRTSATPFALDTETVQIQNETIVKRCANPCGYYGQICCGSDQTCYTDSNNQAQCRSGGGGGGGVQQGGGDNGYWKYSTSIWTETDTNVITSIYSSYVGQTPASVEAACTLCGGSGVVPTPAVGASPTAMPLNCDWEAGESSCGNICCSNGEYCEVSGQCGAAASSGKVSAAVRPTSSGTDVVTQEAVSTTTTRPFTPALATGQTLPVTETTADDGGGGLSGGAIAGIVIGVILALIILLLLLLCLCFKAAWDAIVALLCGRRRRKGRRETVEYESYHRSGRGGGQRERTWYGGPANRPSRVERTTTTTRRKTTAAAGLSGLAVALGLKKKNDDRRRRRDEKSDYTSSYGSYSSYSDPSSSDRRTRDTRRSTRR